MGKKNWAKMTNTEVMAAKIDEMYDRLSLIENLLSDLSPGFGRISKEIGPTVKELREVYERDETLQLVKEAGENIPTFIELLRLLETMKGLVGDLLPAVGRITHEISPAVTDIRKAYERDETLELMKKAGENIPTFLELLKLMETMKGLMLDLLPAVGKIVRELSPSITGIREVYEKDETLEFIKKAGENIPTFVELLKLMETGKALLQDLMPAAGKIANEMGPGINTLRESFEKDETMDLLRKAGENVSVFNKLLDFLNQWDKQGTLDYTLEKVAGKEIDLMLKGMQSTAAKTMQQFMEKPPKPGMGNLVKAMMDPEVQKGFLFMTAFAKNLSRCMAEACMLEPPK